MKNTTISVILGVDAQPADLGALSQQALENNIHLIVLLLRKLPPVPVFYMGLGEFSAYSLPEGWQADVDKANTALEAQRAKISQYLADQGASAEVRAVFGDVSGLRSAVAHAGLTCDTIIIGDDLRSDEQLFKDVVHAALFESSAGVMLNTLGTAEALQPKSAFVAWKSGVPAARAIRAALPALRTAQDVTVALFDPVSTVSQDGENPGSDVAAWLNHQGCTVAVQQYPSSGQDTGTAILKRAKEIAADLIVMGAYGHSRLRETVFGGTTQTLIEQRDRPVLLCH
ncbi:universal stress protein [Sulfitobacter pseudonitzschiae]|uniref:Universal stress protein n=1 Tax=Pseudosulfitobacter pseudonitzschiae TaxID=1402135 RepID=A0A9Q2NQY6_9RHOB|nr:universal stress protein [Pseudosulfitobacter pseudonitzschiae]MBM2291096.1 universal stress protein [Pseudosulfitobacter pseudonitzschiae]MBM2296014.1 universal stress protein [Pseudosulfitobacter pseudonitzschiae]MBM2300927.1 universal stress protein [Pseudosulfitobacter pseudonitzschiae]MBM2310711.1 universal stress protein [Pseudosulfitobacter pseudonitzschiae]MBM2315624.1 universal stress protein [Pseudosulfitobacter pseudonitzschiae]